MVAVKYYTRNDRNFGVYHVFDVLLELDSFPRQKLIEDFLRNKKKLGILWKPTRNFWSNVYKKILRYRMGYHNLGIQIGTEFQQKNKKMQEFDNGEFYLLFREILDQALDYISHI